MINHEAKYGFPSNIIFEKYENLGAEEVRLQKNGKVRRSVFMVDAVLTHDLIGSSISIILEDRTITVDIGRLVNDIVEVEYENKDLYVVC